MEDSLPPQIHDPILHLYLILTEIAVRYKMWEDSLPPLIHDPTAYIPNIGVAEIAVRYKMWEDSLPTLIHDPLLHIYLILVWRK